MDPWKPIRLCICIGVMLGILAGGAWARIVGGGPNDLPDGPWYQHQLGFDRLRKVYLDDGPWYQFQLGSDGSERFYVRANPFVAMRLQWPGASMRWLAADDPQRADYIVRYRDGRIARFVLSSDPGTSDQLEAGFLLESEKAQEARYDHRIE
jgi:hypothetical protein